MNDAIFLGLIFGGVWWLIRSNRGLRRQLAERPLPSASAPPPVPSPWTATVRVAGKVTTRAYPAATCEADVLREVLRAGVDPRAVLAVTGPPTPPADGNSRPLSRP